MTTRHGPFCGMNATRLQSDPSAASSVGVNQPHQPLCDVKLRLVAVALLDGCCSIFGPEDRSLLPPPAKTR